MKWLSVVRWKKWWIVTYQAGGAIIDITSMQDWSYPVAEGQQLVRYGRYVAGVWWKAPRELPYKEEVI